MNTDNKTLLVMSAQRRIQLPSATRVGEIVGEFAYIIFADKSSPTQGEHDGDVYHSWERGLNENTNGLIRQYFPKVGDLREVSGEEIAFVMERLNHRPQKKLAFKKPHDIFAKTG